MKVVDVSVVIPTYQREQVLVETLNAVLACGPAAAEIILVDQTAEHKHETQSSLQRLEEKGVLRWIRLNQPSIPKAMNLGLQAAGSDVVLFLDDDIAPDWGLVGAHIAAHREFPDIAAVVGQVLQPGEASAARSDWKPCEGFLADLNFPFWSNERAWVRNVMAGNLSVKREMALESGGFDENFQGAAYRFETEFARRVTLRGGRILFEPAANLRHLRAGNGGTRSQGSHLTSASPRHGMGDYYFAMQCGWNVAMMRYMLRRPLREVATRFHLKHPWYIPVKLVGEFRGFWAAFGQWYRGARLLKVRRTHN